MVNDDENQPPPPPLPPEPPETRMETSIRLAMEAIERLAAIQATQMGFHAPRARRARAAGKTRRLSASALRAPHTCRLYASAALSPQAKRVGCKVLETGPLLAGTFSERKNVRKLSFCILNIIKEEIPDTGSNVFSNPKHAGSIQNDKDPSGSTQDPPQDPFRILCQTFALPLP